MGGGVVMNVVSFTDLDDQNINISRSSIATCDGYRIFINPDENTEACIHLSQYQASILINAIKDMMREDGND